MEEKNVNEVFEFDGTTLQVVETEEMNCKNCYFNEFCKKSPFLWVRDELQIDLFSKKKYYFSPFFRFWLLFIYSN